MFIGVNSALIVLLYGSIELELTANVRHVPTVSTECVSVLCGCLSAGRVCVCVF